MNQRRILKIVAVGDVQKAFVLSNYATGAKPGEYNPTPFDFYKKDMYFQNEPLTLTLYDTPGGENTSEIRMLNYTGANAFVILFDLYNPSTLNSVHSLYAPEIQAHDQFAPTILCGYHKFERDYFYENVMKADGNSIHPVTTQQGKQFKDSIGASYYCEIDCSDSHVEGVENLFTTAIKLALGEPLNDITCPFPCQVM